MPHHEKNSNKADIEAQKELERRFGGEIQKRQFQKIAKKINVNRGDVYGVWHGLWKSNKVRIGLGMNPLFVDVVPCSCGKVHDHKCKIGKQIEQRKRSTTPNFLRVIQEVIIPRLSERELETKK